MDRSRKRNGDAFVDDREDYKKSRNGDDAPMVSEEQLKGKEVMYQAQMAIQERKRQLNIANNRTVPPALQVKAPPIHSHTAKLTTAEASVFMASQIDKRSEKLNELKAKLAANNALATLNKKPAATAALVVPLKKDPLPIVKEAVPTAPVEEEPSSSREKFEFKPYLDPRLKVRGAARGRREAFQFHEKGTFEALANKQRQTAQLEKLQSKISETAKSTGISSAVRLAMVTPAIQDSSDVPEVEWWDEIVLNGTGYDGMPSPSEPIAKRYVTTITDLIEHPVQLKPPNEAPAHLQTIRTHLTKREMKKIRRQNRKEALKEKQEKVRLGLEKPPEPKVKMSNLMRVLGDDAIKDPTKMEEHVKKQIAERLRKHEQDNEDRKLTKEQRAAKKTKKISEDVSLGVHVAVYKVKSLQHPKKKFKVECNAKQLQMTGAIIYHKLFNVVAVEGGPKQQKFFKNLMMQRIKWGDEIIGQKNDVEDKDVPGERNECHLVWEGVVKKRAFQELRSISATSEKHAREILDKHGVAHYWDLSYSTTLLNPDQEE